MRRMLRIFLGLGLGLSTILFVGTGVLWVRSLGHAETWNFHRFEPRPDWTAPDVAGCGIDHWWYAGATHGRLRLGSGTLVWGAEPCAPISYSRNPLSADKAKKDFDWSFEPCDWSSAKGAARAWRFAGAGMSRFRAAIDPDFGRPPEERCDLAIPFWLLAVVFGLWPVCFVARWVLRRRRYGPGLCPSCGYDLRATPDRCPECGRVMTGA